MKFNSVCYEISIEVRCLSRNESEVLCINHLLPPTSVGVPKRRLGVTGFEWVIERRSTLSVKELELCCGLRFSASDTCSPASPLNHFVIAGVEILLPNIITVGRRPNWDDVQRFLFELLRRWAKSVAHMAKSSGTIQLTQNNSFYIVVNDNIYSV